MVSISWWCTVLTCVSSDSRNLFSDALIASNLTIFGCLKTWVWFQTSNLLISSWLEHESKRSFEIGKTKRKKWHQQILTFRGFPYSVWTIWKIENIQRWSYLCYKQWLSLSGRSAQPVYVNITMSCAMSKNLLAGKENLLLVNITWLKLAFCHPNQKTKNWMDNVYTAIFFECRTRTYMLLKEAPAVGYLI